VNNTINYLPPRHLDYHNLLELLYPEEAQKGRRTREVTF
jgi:hypothetical protein